MTQPDLTALMKDLESDLVERKSSDADRGRIAEAICAFSNDLPNHRRPGYILVGVADNGDCGHAAIDDRLLQNLAHIRSNGQILPLPIISVSRVEHDGCTFALVRVEPHPSPPVRYDGRTWIRVGPRRAIASIDEERMLAEKHRAANSPFDQRTVYGAALEDLNTERFRNEYLPFAIARETLRADNRSDRERLAALRLLSNENSPNLAAVLALADDPRRFVPSAYIQFVRYDGDDVFSAIKDEKEIDGPLSSMLQTTDDVLKSTNSVEVDFRSEDREVNRPEYSLIALQQIVRNAVMHRNYETSNAPIRIYWFDKRVEIHSPGGLYGQVNEANFGKAGITDYRNPLLAEVMKTLGFVQRFGIGVVTALRESEDNGNPPIDFQFSISAVVAVIRK